ncbi:MAG TPA: polysaccharide deacetylase family protein [Acidimicrobiia bacterium]|nr:polysaccharide deacetylase family protein [Acidimicrobiia bacterium]
MSPSLARRGLKVFAAGADVVRPRPSGVVVLIYHRVGGGSGLEIDLPEPVFDEQMATLAASRRTTTIDDALAALAGPSPGAAHDLVVVTFDDGTADVVDVALPVLVRHRVPALLYVSTDFVESGREFPFGGRPASWAALRDAISTGFLTVGSHTHTHALLDRASPADAERELDRSIELIGERLGVRAEHFAYPKALPGSPAAAALVRSRFRSAALAGTRPNRYGRTDPYRLARTPIQTSDAPPWFRRKLAGGMRTEDDLRRVLNRFRYAKARR